MSQFMILFKHALRNAILPVITYVGPMLASLMTGSVVVEKIFSVPGLGLSLIHILWSPALWQHTKSNSIIVAQSGRAFKP